MLKVDYEALGAAAKILSDEGDTFEDCIAKMDKEIQGLPDIWEADTCDKYVEQFNNAKKTLDEVRKLIQDMSDQMIQISNNYRDADESMADQI